MVNAGSVRKLAWMSLALAGLAQAGCSTMSHTDRGILTGGGLGAVAGTVVGSALGDPGAGAVIGTGLGAVAGGVAGNARDERERRDYARAAYEAQQQAQLGLQEVADLTRSGTSDAVIIDQIRATGSTYRLTAEQIGWLQQAGVRQPVIQAMIQTGYRPPRVVHPAVYAPEPVVVVEPVPVFVPPPPPPPRVGFGVIYHHHPRCR